MQREAILTPMPDRSGFPSPHAKSHMPGHAAISDGATSGESAKMVNRLTGVVGQARESFAAIVENYSFGRLPSPTKCYIVGWEEAFSSVIRERE
jgi:hypothetical protein